MRELFQPWHLLLVIIILAAIVFVIIMITKTNNNSQVSSEFNKTMKSKFITSVTYILIGNMLLIYNSIGSGWTTIITNIFGLILFFIGLSRMKSYLDKIGQNGVSKLIWATILGIIATVFSYIPIVGIIPAGILNLIAFILQIVGLVNLKNSTTLGTTGARGVNYLLIAMVFMIIASLFGIIPFAGNFIKPIISFIAFILIPFGWLKIQEAIIESQFKTLQENSKNHNICSGCGTPYDINNPPKFCTNCGQKI